MNIILTALTYACLVVIGIMVLLYLLFMFHYVRKFMMHKCGHCNHRMEFKGLKDDDANGHYLFHCEHCGAWEQIPKEELLRV